MESKEEEAKKLTSEHHEPPPPYACPYGYPIQGQAYGYPPQQLQSQEAFSQQQAQYAQPQYGQPQPQYAQQQLQYGQPQYGQLQLQTNQPGAYPQQVIIVTSVPMANPPPDHLIFNIIMTLFCCWPIGICAIMKSLECRNAVQNGDRPRAESFSRSAKRLGMWTLGIGTVFIMIFFALAILVEFFV